MRSCFRRAALKGSRLPPSSNACCIAHSGHMQGAYSWAGSIENEAGKCLIS